MFFNRLSKSVEKDGFPVFAIDDPTLGHDWQIATNDAYFKRLLRDLKTKK